MVADLKQKIEILTDSLNGKNKTVENLNKNYSAKLKEFECEK